MKDIVIKSRHVRLELLVFGICFIVAFFVNLGAVIYYHRPSIEILSQLGFVVVIALSFYFLTAAVHMICALLAFGIKKLTKSNIQ